MMGCAHGKEISTRNRNQEERKQSSILSGKQSQVSSIKKKDNKNDMVNSDDKEQRKESCLRQRTENNGSKPDPRRSNPPKNLHGEQVAAGWPSWLSAVAGEALHGWTPRRADSFKKITKVGQGTYSNVYKAMDCESGKIVALKKVRFDHSEIESLKFMAREILILRRLDHPNIVKLNGLATSRLSSSLYLVFDYMEHDLAGLAASPGIKFTEPQVKCYMQQLLSGLEHCHKHGVLHRDIKGSNLLLDNTGTLKIADFGLALFYDPNCRHRMTSRVVTLWYRAPELLMGATEYGDGIDLWSAGCILAELLAGRPIMPGRTEVEQLHKIFKLCGSPSDEYWKKSKLPHATVCKPKEPYKRCIVETFKDFPPSALSLIENLLTIDPSERPTSSEALKSEFFRTEPYACDPASLPVYPPSKEIDARLRDEEQRRLRAAHGKTETGKKSRVRDRPVPVRAIAALDANAELQANLDRRRLINRANATCKSEKFPPPHQDGSIGYPLGSSQRMDHSFYDDSSTIFMNQNESLPSFSGSLLAPNKFASRNPEKVKKSFGHPQKKNHIQA